MKSRVKTLGRETLCFFSGKVTSVVAEALFPRVRGSICKSYRQKVYRTVARARFHIKILQNDGFVYDLCGQVSIVSAAPTLVNSLRHSCYAGLLSTVTKRIGTAASSIWSSYSSCLLMSSALLYQWQARECTGQNILGRETQYFFGQSGCWGGYRCVNGDAGL